MKIGHCGDLQVMAEFTMLIQYKTTLVRRRYLNTLHFPLSPGLCLSVSVLYS